MLAVVLLIAFWIRIYWRFYVQGKENYLRIPDKVNENVIPDKVNENI